MNGIQSYASGNLANVLLSGYSQMNNMKLAQALAGKDLSAIPGASSAVKNTAGLSAGDSEFLKDYQTNLQELRAAADKVLSGGETGRLAAGAEDLSVAEVTGKLASASDRYTLTVEQLASGQVNRSADMDGDGALPTMGGALRVQTSRGSYDFYLSAAGARTNREMLQNFASKLNAAKTGVTASVVERDGKAFLQMEGAAGEENSFSVSGTLAERLGLDQVAQQGQDAVYTVQKNGGEAQRLTSKSNTVTLDGRLTARLKGAGTTQVRMGADTSSGLADAVSDLVDRYNATLGFLDRNSDRGIGVLNQLKRMTLPPTSERSMALAGISVKTDGSLRFDRETFLEKMQNSPQLMGEVVENVAKGIRTDAQQGMRERSGDLLGTVAYSQRLADSQQDPLNFLSMYSRSGVYNLMNYYAVGALMNLNA